MNINEFPSVKLSRRDLLKGAGVLVGAGLMGCENEEGNSEYPGLLGAGASTSRRKVAVLGAGAGGIAASYFLGPDFDVDLFESRSKVGGHCDSREFTYQGKQINVDLGAQFFHPDTHPIYATLLEELGLFKPESPDSDETIEANGSLTLFKPNGGWPVFASNYPYLMPHFAIDFAIYSQYARNFILNNGSWETTVEDWIKSLPVSQNFKDNLLQPWISALIGTTAANARVSSARSILQTFALAFPANIFASAKTYNSNLGLGGNLGRLLERSSNVTTLTDSAVQGLTFNNGEWTVQTASGAKGPYSAVILNAPPHATKGLLQPLPWAGDIVASLEQFQWFDARMLIHTDPKYVHKDKHLWAAYNGTINGAECEGSVWYGGIHQKLPSGNTVDVFKSWAAHRTSDPANIVYERRFKHPHITVQTIKAARALKGYQGRNGLYFSGQHTTGFDLQEAAVWSAIKVANALTPNSSTLTALKARLKTRGRDKIGYDL